VYASELERVGATDAVEPSTVAKDVLTDDGCAILHLSTRLRPADRLHLIETAKRLTDEGYPLITIATQLVEAGVDISFDRVYRDLAPVDSIVQAAGRCNRSFERDTGRVVVWWLDVPADQDKTPAEAVYNRDVSLLPVVANTLRDVRDDAGELSEFAVARTAVTQYYERLRTDKNVGKDDYVDYVDQANAAELGTLSLIDQRRSVDILITRTKEERNLATAIREANDAAEYNKLRERLDETTSLRVSVPIYQEDGETAKAVKKLNPLVPDEDVFQLDVRRHQSFFENRTGFVVPDRAVDHRIL
jgi:hypothetical protein